MSSLISVAYGMPLIAIPAIVSGTFPEVSASSRMMSAIAAATKPMRFPYTPTDRQPIFTSFGGASPPFSPRVRSHVTVSGERWSSSPISFSLSPFSLYSVAFFASASTLFMFVTEWAIPRTVLKVSNPRPGRTDRILNTDGAGRVPVRTRDAAILAVATLAGALTLFLVSIQGSGGMMGGMMGGVMGAMALAGVLFFVAIAILLLAFLARPAAPPWPPFPAPPPMAIPPPSPVVPESPPNAAAPSSSAVESALVRLLDEDERLLYTRLRDAGATVLQNDVVAWGTFSAAKVTRLLDRLEPQRLLLRQPHPMTNRIRLAYR